jgi:hypothetical protein
MKKLSFNNAVGFMSMNQLKNKQWFATKEEKKY